jgi:hypothetical protein
MSIMNPRGIIGVIGVVLVLIALYLILEHYAGATSILSSLANGSIGLVGTLQGRTVSGGGGAGYAVGVPV